jgi:hypothetical protein
MLLEDAIEHVRKEHTSIRRPGAVGCAIGIFMVLQVCETALKDHRGFNSHEAIWNHLKDYHHFDIIRLKMPGLRILLSNGLFTGRRRRAEHIAV